MTLQETPKDGSVRMRKKSHAVNSCAKCCLQPRREPAKDSLSSLWLMTKPGVRWKTDIGKRYNKLDKRKDTLIDICEHFFLVFEIRLLQINYDDSKLWGVPNISSKGERMKKNQAIFYLFCNVIQSTNQLH